ncbi:hypothetical protein SMAC4_13450 [Sordaria macrospora]|uniref:uncharacterized protein n=1 Tax=Sordaria macrospora TaxID=5147 RepID=UPI002B2F028A|nr:hypothetical protein SMAC4_13450 [Sordaria macrospora]
MSLSFLRLHQQQPFKLYQSPPAQQPFPIPSKSSTSKFSANPLSSSALHQHKSQCQTQSTATPTAARTTRCFPVINNTSIAPLTNVPILRVVRETRRVLSGAVHTKMGSRGCLSSSNDPMEREIGYYVLVVVWM